ncbi:cytochrome c-type biogenesis protein CcmH precursor [bacterium BMS3Bbin10]|nr:cytochrome c-type biogenesis protein CcmH precursor [bacterium BMS3Bbin10]
MVRFFTIVLLAWLMAIPAKAVEPDEILKDPVLEARARGISLELRCLVCQNQSIDDSNAPLARDLRILVRKRLTKGDSDGEVINFLVARYGEFVLLRPRFAPHTMILWLSAPILFLFSIFAIYKAYRRRSEEVAAAPAKALTAKEKRELTKLLKQH